MTDKQLCTITRQFRQGLLGKRSSHLMCAVVCYPLAGYLSFIGVTCDLASGDHEGGNHVWITLPDGRVLDPTLDQFAPEVGQVYLGAPVAPWHTQERRQ